MNNDFRIGMRIKSVSFCLKFVPQTKKIVNLSVENDPHGTVFVMDRLVATSDVDDAEAPHAQPHPTLGVYSLVVRAPVDNRSAHFMHSCRIYWCLVIIRDDSSYAAHALS